MAESNSVTNLEVAGGNELLDGIDRSEALVDQCRDLLEMTVERSYAEPLVRGRVGQATPRWERPFPRRPQSALRLGSPWAWRGGARHQEGMSPPPRPRGHLDRLELGEEIAGLGERCTEDLFGHIEELEEHGIADRVEHAGPLLAALN